MQDTATRNEIGMIVVVTRQTANWLEAVGRGENHTTRNAMAAEILERIAAAGTVPEKGAPVGGRGAKCADDYRAFHDRVFLAALCGMLTGDTSTNGCNEDGHIERAYRIAAKAVKGHP